MKYTVVGHVNIRDVSSTLVTMPVAITSEDQAPNLYGLDNWILLEIPARVIYGYREEEETSFQMVYDLLNSDELFGRYATIADVWEKVRRPHFWPMPKVLGSVRAPHTVGPGSIPARDKFPGWGFFGAFPHP